MQVILATHHWDDVQEPLAGPWPIERFARATTTAMTGGDLLRAGSPLSRGVKRVFDVVVASIVLLLSLPLLLGLALAVRRDGGPALYRHERVGRGGRTIKVLKFRSMVPNAEQVLRSQPDLRAEHVANGFKLAPEDDPRITPLGRALRAWSLDELPQLVNVVRGDMSLVGPRPVVPDELLEYDLRCARAEYLAVRPGMTGPWQVSGRSLLGYDERVALDADYVHRIGLWTDLRILGRTGGAVVDRVGAH